MPISATTNIFNFPENRQQRNSGFDTFKGLPGLLADILPDKYGNQLIDVWLAQNGRPRNSMNPVETLCFIGSRGMGALEFEPTKFKQDKRAINIKIRSLVNIAQKMLSNKEGSSTNIEKDDEKAMMDILKIGTSAGGARPKALIAYNERTGQVRSGQTKAPIGFEQWLIKLDDVSDIQLGENKGYGSVEMAYYLMATDCGINMMPSKLLEENGRAHFMTKRFDREGAITKYHVQTWCAMQHLDFNEVRSFSYEQLFQCMRELKLTYPEAEQLYRRMVFNVMAKNCDDHTKNFAFILQKGGKWRLSPAYDICHAFRPDSEWVNQHALSINGKRKGITKSDLLAVAKSMNIKKANTIINDINKIVNNWELYAKKANVDSKKRKAIAKTLINFDLRHCCEIT